MRLSHRRAREQLWFPMSLGGNDDDEEFEFDIYTMLRTAICRGELTGHVNLVEEPQQRPRAALSTYDFCELLT